MTIGRSIDGDTYPLLLGCSTRSRNNEQGMPMLIYAYARTSPHPARVNNTRRIINHPDKRAIVFFSGRLIFLCFSTYLRCCNHHIRLFCNESFGYSWIKSLKDNTLLLFFPYLFTIGIPNI